MKNCRNILKVALIYTAMFGQIAYAKTAKLFQEESVLKAELIFDITRFQVEKENLRETGLRAVLKLEGQSPLNIEILSRGAASMENEMPPFKLHFKKSLVKDTIFKGLKKVKVVIPIDLNDPNSDKFILSQYLTYKLYELYSPVAYKTRLVQMQLVDSSGDKEFESKLFILLEPNRNLSKRLNLKYIPFKADSDQNVSVLKERIDLELAHSLIAFNFFIRNFDSAIPGMQSTLGKNFGIEGVFPTEKNVKMFLSNMGLYRPVPYDFDLAGTNDYGACVWSILHLMLAEEGERSDADLTFTPGLECVKEEVEHSLQRSFAVDVHQEKLLQYREKYLNTVDLWRARYQDDLKKLDSNYMKNFDIHLEALKRL